MPRSDISRLLSAIGTVLIAFMPYAGAMAQQPTGPNTQRGPDLQQRDQQAQPPQSSPDYRNRKYGFALRVPPEHFVAGNPRNPDEGGLWVSRDGRARLIAVAAPNTSGESLDSYRRFVMQETYKSASFDYTPVRDNWFVLSGSMGGQLFYERITFACQGRYIYGWQVMYPADQKRLYDRLVEAIHRSYRPGRGEDGNCN